MEDDGNHGKEASKKEASEKEGSEKIDAASSQKKSR